MRDNVLVAVTVTTEGARALAFSGGEPKDKAVIVWSELICAGKPERNGCGESLRLGRHGSDSSLSPSASLLHVVRSDASRLYRASEASF